MHDKGKEFPIRPVLLLLCLLLAVNFLMGIPWSPEVIDLVLSFTTVLAWPLFALIVWFGAKDSIIPLIGRVSELWIGSAGAKLAPQERKDPEAKTAIEQEEIEKLETEENVSPSPEPQADIERELFAKNIELSFERIFRTIFGTQLQALERLKAYSSGLKAEELNDLVALHQKRMGVQAYSNVVEHLKYPVSSELVEFDPAQQVYKLTLRGQIFLSYLGSQNLSANLKPF